MDWFDLKIGGRDLLNRARGLRWSNADERRVIVLITGAFLCALLLPAVVALLVVPLLTTTQSQRASELNRTDAGGEPAPLDHLLIVRDRLIPAVRADDRFAGVLIRPGASVEAPHAVATVQGTVGDRAAFDDLYALIEQAGVEDRVFVRVMIQPAQ